MSFSIAVAGKGGSGKTSLCSLIVRYLHNNDRLPVLAVDADPNANLGEALGLEVTDTVGMMLDRFQKEKAEIPPGMTKEAYLELKLHGILAESRNFDLLTMGRGEGEGCYCYPNSVLRKFIEELSDNYAYIVMDNEAGMEHLSRGTTQDIDELLIVSNHSIRGVRTLARIKDLVQQLHLKVKHQSIIINMVPGEIDSLVTRELERLELKPDVAVPMDEQMSKFDLEMRSFLELPENSPATAAVDRFLQQILPETAKV